MTRLSKGKTEEYQFLVILSKRTIAALSNFDHTYPSSTLEMLSNHDTVIVLFQEKAEGLPSKLKKTYVCIQQLEQSNELPCQELRLCNRGKKELIFPETFTVSQEKTDLPCVNRDIDAFNFVLSTVRFDQNLSDTDAMIPTWAACRSLLSDKTLSIWQVEFLSYLQYPIIKYDTVFTALYNLANVANQLQ